MGSDEIEFLENWTIRNLQKASFEDAIYLKDEQVWYRFLEHYLAYFIMRLDLEVDEPTYLNLLWVDSYYLPHKSNAKTEARLIDFVIDKTSEIAVRAFLLENLATGVKIDVVLMKYVAHCDNLRIFESLPYILAELNANRITNSQKIEVAKHFLSLKGNVTDIDTLVLSFTNVNHERFRFMHLFESKVTPRLSNHLCGLLKAGDVDSNEKIEISRFLISEGIFAGLLFFLEFTKDKRMYPDNGLSKEGVAKMNRSDILPVLIELLEQSLMPDFRNEHISSIDSTVLSIVIELGSDDQETHDFIEKKFIQFIQAYGAKAKFLYYQLDALNQQYYLKKFSGFTFQEATRVVNELNLNEGRGHEINKGATF